MRRAIAFVMMIFVAAGLAACADPAGDFAAAEEVHTEAAYRSFLEKHGDSELAAHAREKIAELAMEKADATGTVAAYEAFLSEHGESSRADEARASLADLEFAAAESAATLDAWHTFLQYYPESRHAPVAKSRAAELAFAALPEEPDTELMAAFAERYAGTEQSGIVQRRLNAVREQNALASVNTQAGYREFMSDFPDSDRVHIARGEFVGGLVIFGEGGQILIGPFADKKFRVSRVDDPAFPAVEMNDWTAVMKRFIPVSDDGEYTLSYANRYRYHEAFAIAVMREDGAHELVHFEFDRMSEEPNPDAEGSISVTGGSKGFIRVDAVEGLPRLPEE